MLYYDNEWKLSKYKIYYTDKDLNKNMENYVGVEGIEWWQNLDFITINRVEDLTYTEEELKRYAEIKNKPQSENSRQLECYIKGIDYTEEPKEEKPKEDMVLTLMNAQAESFEKSEKDKMDIMQAIAEVYETTLGGN